MNCDSLSTGALVAFAIGELESLKSRLLALAPQVQDHSETPRSDRGDGQPADEAASGKRLLTPSEAEADLLHKGISVRAWARQNQVSPVVVYRVLDGRCKGLRGEGHKVAVLLGIKDGEIAS